LRGGYDCGDPCPPPKKKETADPKAAQDTTSQPPAPTGANIRLPGTTAGSEEEAEEPKDTTRHYCLYIRYCETLTDPVSPYATDEGCSYQSCQATRVSEGVSFELRCEEDCGHPPDIRDRICECIGDLDSAFQTTQSSNSFLAATRLQKRVENVELTDRFAAGRNFVSSVAALQKVQIPQPPAPAASAEPPTATVDQPATLIMPSLADRKIEINVDEFEGWLSDVQTADAHLASYYLSQQVKDKPEIKAAEGPTNEEVRTARNQLRDTANLLSAHVNNVSAPELARGYYAAALKHTIDLAADQPALPESRLREIAKGEMLVLADFQSSIAAIAAMREELLDRLDRSPRTGDCQLRFDVEAIRLPGSQSSISEWIKAFKQLHAAWVRYLKDCICAAFNPPCAPCEDPAVLLACIEVKDCKVVEICNLKRKFVISGPALRYWLPPLNMVGDLLERLCCPDPICMEEEDTAAGKQAILGLRGRYTLPTKLPGRINFSILPFLCGSREKEASSFISKGFRNSGAGVTYRQFGENQRLTDSLRSLGSEILRSVPRISFAQPVVDVRNQIRDLAVSMKSEDFTMLATEALKAHPGLAGEVMAELAGEKVADAVAKLRTTAAKDLKDVKRIKTENVELKKIIKEQGDRAKELMDRVEKLEKGTPQ